MAAHERSDVKCCVRLGQFGGVDAARCSLRSNIAVAGTPGAPSSFAAFWLELADLELVSTMLVASVLPTHLLTRRYHIC